MARGPFLGVGDIRGVQGAILERLWASPHGPPTTTQLREARTVIPHLRLSSSQAGSCWGLPLAFHCFHHYLPPFAPLCANSGHVIQQTGLDLDGQHLASSSESVLPDRVK